MQLCDRLDVVNVSVDLISLQLGPRDFFDRFDTVIQATQGETSALTINVETEDEFADPRIISMSGVWGATERKLSGQSAARLVPDFTT
jgi:hypothetical protein